MERIGEIVAQRITVFAQRGKDSVHITVMFHTRHSLVNTEMHVSFADCVCIS